VIPRRAHARKWRLRGRRGQVAPVATILGLLLVVTFIANYLTTTLPNQMSANDLNHVLEVENQVGQLQALLEEYTAHGAVGAQLTQPVTLGSASAPPFAGPDSGTIGPARNGSGYNIAYSLSGLLAYRPPTGGTPNSGYLPPSAGCAPANPTTTLTCTGTGGVTWNFSAATPTTYAVTGTTGVYAINITDNGASRAAPAAISITAAGSATIDLLVLGSNDTVTVAASTHANTVYDFLIVGNNDTLLIGAISQTASIAISTVGVDDQVDFGAVSQTITVLAQMFGFSDYFSQGNASSHAGTRVSVFFGGFNPLPTSTACPVGTLAASTDHLNAASGQTGTFTATFNGTSALTPTVSAPWTAKSNALSPTESACPLYSSSLVSVGGVRSAGLDVHLLNTYIPQSDVAFDAGAVVFAQPGGTPLLVDPPGLSVTESSTGAVTAVALWFPIFVGQLPTDAGISTTEISARLISDTAIVLGPTSTYTVANNSNIVFTVTTPFAAGWMSYYASIPAYSGWFSCAPSTSVACTGPYASGGSLGTVTLSIPTGTQLNTFSIEVATFAISLV
jgi:hypothetical protein